jgi:hypothetical protein
MKYLGLTTLIFGIIFLNCNQNNQKSAKADKKHDKTEVTKDSLDKKEIQNLIQQVLIWSNSKKSIDLLPFLTDSKDSVYLGFDRDKLKINLDKLRATGFFSTEFIENYNQIILTLDNKLRNKEIEGWLVGDLPTFKFANDINPWCLCQDKPSIESFQVEIIKIDSKSGELIWKWRNDSSWKDFSFRVAKEDNKWKISYMEGFDFKESTKRDGEI